MILGDFSGSLDERMEKLEDLAGLKQALIIVGSSYGAVMAVLFASKKPRQVKKLVLLSPALTLDEVSPRLPRRLDLPVIVYHGRFDEIIPLGPVHSIAHRLFSDLTFHILEDDHVLSNSFSTLDWPGLLEIHS
jgi:pimeloyl-ACP methyl ester carboxylesterase